jgi:hypothetical protein
MVEAVVLDVESKIANLEQGLRKLLKRTGVRALSQGLSVLDQSYPGRGTLVLVGRWSITSFGARCARDDCAAVQSHHRRRNQPAPGL